jgi:DNA polymerase-3 subunit epsilon
MLVAGFDTETTGLDTANDKIIEVGVALWDTERRVPLLLYSDMILPPGLTELPPKITEITGIQFDDLANHGRAPSKVLSRLMEIFGMAEAIVAHNGNLFDKPILASNLKAAGMHEPTYNLNFKPWVDTSCDIEFPPDLKTRKLKHLAAEHGFLNPFAHRALFDVLTMLKVCNQYDWAKILASARTPNHVVQAVMPFSKQEMFETKKAEFEKMKEIIKGHGFRFDSDNKAWVKTIKEYNKDAAKAEAAAGGYTLKLVKKEEPNADKA